MDGRSLEIIVGRGGAARGKISQMARIVSGLKHGEKENACEHIPGFFRS